MAVSLGFYGRENIIGRENIFDPTLGQLAQGQGRKKRNYFLV
jgi:hypothetical protein